MFFLLSFYCTDNQNHQNFLIILIYVKIISNMYHSKANLILRKCFYKFMILRTFKNLVQPKIPITDKTNLETDMLSTLRSAVEVRVSAPTLAGDPRLPKIPHQKIREDVFERWIRTSKTDHNRICWLKNTFLS